MNKQNKLIKIITIMKKIIIITVVTLAVISIIVFRNKTEFSTIVKRNIAQCKMYNKVLDSEWCEIDSLVRTFPQEYIILTIGEDGKVSEVQVPNDYYYGLESMINERIDSNEFDENLKEFHENQKKFDEWNRAMDEFNEYLDLGGEIDFRIVYPNNSKKGVKTKELNNFLNSKAKLIEYVAAYFDASYVYEDVNIDDVKYKTICKVIKKKFITDDNLNIQYSYNEDTNTVIFEVINN